MVKELLPPENIIKMLKKRLSQLKYTLAYKKKTQTETPPPGHLRIAQVSKKPQYYHCTKENPEKGKFIPRSQEELAHQLAQHNIPYRYEYPLNLERSTAIGIKDTITVHPDFICLNVHNRTEFYWEHFGLMDSSDYCQNVVSKLALYADNMLFPGHNLIFTMENQITPLSSKLINSLIEEFLL